MPTTGRQNLRFLARRAATPYPVSMKLLLDVRRGKFHAFGSPVCPSKRDYRAVWGLCHDFPLQGKFGTFPISPRGKFPPRALQTRILCGCPPSKFPPKPLSKNTRGKLSPKHRNRMICSDSGCTSHLRTAASSTPLKSNPCEHFVLFWVQSHPDVSQALCERYRPDLRHGLRTIGCNQRYTIVSLKVHDCSTQTLIYLRNLPRRLLQIYNFKRRISIPTLIKKYP